MEERPGRDAEVVAARAAVELLARLEPRRVGRLAARAADAVGPAQRLEVGAAALLRARRGRGTTRRRRTGTARREETSSVSVSVTGEPPCRIAIHHNRSRTEFAQEILRPHCSSDARQTIAEKRGGPYRSPLFHTTGVSVAAGSAHFPAALSTPRTRAGVIGASRSRTPVASKNALATAAGTGDSAGSPEPVVREPGPGRVGHVGAGESVDVDLGRVLEPDHRIADPVEAGDALLVEVDLLVETHAKGPASQRLPRCSRCRPGRRSGRRRPRRAARWRRSCRCSSSP